MPRTPFTLEQIESAWKLYGSEVKDRNFKAGLIVNSSTISLEGEKMIVNVENFVQQKQVAEFREEATLFLREQLNNHGIVIDALIKTSKETKQSSLTAQEKFNSLAEKHPALNKLKDIFQLEIIH